MTKKPDVNQEDIVDDKDLDQLFEGRRNKFTAAIRRAKWHNLILMGLVSLVVLAVAVIGGSSLVSGANYRMEGKIQIATSSFYDISAPNKYIGKHYRYHYFLSGQNQYTTYKLIEGRVVYTGTNEYGWGLWRGERNNLLGTESPSILGYSFDAEDLDLQHYNELGQREMVFFYPFVNYQQYKNDLELLPQLGDKYAEMALSFDDYYTMDEVNKMLPQDVTLAWYWIDDLSEQEKQDSQPRQQEQEVAEGKTEIVDYPARIRSELTAYGIKAYNTHYQKYDDPLWNFVTSLQHAKEYKTRYQWEAERVFNNLAGTDGEITKDDIRVMGVVVTGDRESLATLTELPFIKAASLGVTVDRY